MSECSFKVVAQVRCCHQRGISAGEGQFLQLVVLQENENPNLINRGGGHLCGPEVRQKTTEASVSYKGHVTETAKGIERLQLLV